MKWDNKLGCLMMFVGPRPGSVNACGVHRFAKFHDLDRFVMFLGGHFLAHAKARGCSIGACITQDDILVT